MKTPIYTKNIPHNFLHHLSGLATSTSENFYCGHTGPSMNPTLTAQDLLEIKPFHNKRPQAGDVILFQSPEIGQYSVHRIVSIEVNGIQTRGDNNRNTDPIFLKQVDIFGKVIAAQRGSLQRRIANGYLGRIVGKYCQFRRLFLIFVFRLFRPVYQALSADGFLHWLIPVRLTPQVATFHNNANVSYRLMLGKHIIGSYDESLLQWQIRRPYRLFVDESSLPKPR